MAGPQRSSPTGFDPILQQCAHWAISIAARWGDGRIIQQKTRTCHSDDENKRCYGFER